MLSRERLGTLVAVLLGTAVLTTFLLLLTSGRPQVPERLEQFAVLVQSPAADNRPDEFAEPVPWAGTGALIDALRAVPGAGAVEVDRTFYAQPVLGGRPVADSTTGHAWLGAGPPRPGELIAARELGVPVGADLTVLTGAGPRTWRVAGHTDLPGVHLSAADAAGLAPGARVIALTGNPGPGAVQAAIGDRGTVLTGEQRGRAEPVADARTRWIGMQVLTATTALAGFACLFLVGSTSAYAVNQRRREIGLLRAVGATPRQVRSMLYRSALRLGAVAAAGGVLTGAVAAVPLARLLVTAGLEPHSYAVRLQPWVLAAAFAAGPLIALAGAGVAARAASRISPIEALRVAEVDERAMSRGRWLTGGLATVAAAAAGTAAATTPDLTDLGSYALLAAMALVVAAVLLAPAVVPVLARLLLAPLPGVVATLARESARTAVRRTASTAAPVLFTVAFAVFVTGTVQTSAAAYDTRRAAAAATGTALIPDGTPGLGDAAAPQAVLDTTVHVGATAVTATGDPAVPAGTALAATAGTGPSVTVTWADGQRETLRVTGTAPPAPFPAELVLSRASVRAHDPSALAPAAFPAPPGPAAAGTRISDPGEPDRQQDAADDRLVDVFTLLLLAVSAGAGALAVVNTLLMTARRRAPDLRVLRLAGATTSQVVRAAAYESALVVVIGSLLGGTAGLLAVAGSARSLTAQVGADVPVLVSWPAVAATVGLCLVLAVAAATIPAARACGRYPVAARKSE